MKILLAFALSALLSSNLAFAKIGSFSSDSVQEMTAQLEVSKLGKAKLNLNNTSVELLNTHLPWQSCQLGEFLVEYLPEGVMSDEAGWYLVDVLECYEDFYYSKEVDEFICPSIYQPVCARPEMTTCPAGSFCLQVMPEERTYENLCAVLRDGAQFQSHGECQGAHTF